MPEAELRHRRNMLQGDQQRIQLSRKMLDIEEKEVVSQLIEINERIGEFVIARSVETEQV